MLHLAKHSPAPYTCANPSCARSPARDELCKRDAGSGAGSAHAQRRACAGTSVGVPWSVGLLVAGCACTASWVGWDIEAQVAAVKGAMGSFRLFRQTEALGTPCTRRCASASTRGPPPPASSAASCPSSACGETVSTQLAAWRWVGRVMPYALPGPTGRQWVGGLVPFLVPSTPGV